ncbi:MAG: metallophosphoesterase, partial [Firmicutes bacterium]|nr:metallophosphoesterase [Bacillota bacterium]
MKNTLRKLTALLLSVVLFMSLFQISAGASDPAMLRVAVLADPHFYADKMTGGFCDAYKAQSASKGRPAELAETLFLAALQEIKSRVKTDGLEYLLVPGDMTRDGEYEGHVRVARLLRDFERDTGIPVAVVPGNHDVSKGNAADYSSGKREQARNLSPDEFLSLYAKLGYDLPNCERMPGTLSYAADLGKRYRLIAFDDYRHALVGAEKPAQEALQAWVVGQCEKAKAAGKTIVGLGHHTLGEQLGGQEALMDNFAMVYPRGVGEAFADAGMHFYLSGHLHLSEIAVLVSDRGEPLYDITTASTASFPGDYRTVKFSTAGKKVTADVRSRAVPLTTKAPYPGPYYAGLFGRTFGADLTGGGLTGNIK